MHHKVSVFWLQLNSTFIFSQRIIIFLLHVIALAETIRNASIDLIIHLILFGQFEVFDCIGRIHQMNLADTFSIISFREFLVNSDGIVEVLDSQLMVTHVLIHDAPGDVDSFVIVDSRQNFRKTFEGILEFVKSVVHETKMEPATHEVLLNIESL